MVARGNRRNDHKAPVSVGFYAWNFIVSGRFPGGTFFVLFAGPCIFFLIDAWVTHSLEIDVGSDT